MFPEAILLAGAIWLKDKAAKRLEKPEHLRPGDDLFLFLEGYDKPWAHWGH